MKIKFLVQTHMDNSNGIIGINPVYFWLKAFYLRHGKHEINWLSTQYELDIDEIEKEQPEILCFSLYGWNKDFINNKIDFSKKIMYRIEHDVHELIWKNDIKQIKELKSFVSIAWNYKFKK